MKKKVLIIVAAVVVIVGSVVTVMALTGGGASEEDLKAGEEIQESVDKNLENAEMPETDPNLDTINTEGIIEEDFNPEDML